jgi:endoglucanase
MRQYFTQIAPALIAACGISCGASAMDGGVNLSGLDFNPGAIPGRPNWDYPVPTGSELSYYKSKGLLLVRLPVLWERLQPGLLASAEPPPIAAGYFRAICVLLNAAHDRGMKIILDLHDYGGYAGNQIGGGVVTNAMFASLWSQLAQRLRNYPGLAGYDLMNEPQGMPSASAWPDAAQAAVNAIRVQDMNTPIYVEGDNWASATTWQQVNGALSIADPANKIVYEAHVYGDQDSSGTHFIWSEAAAAGVTVHTMAQRVANFTAWCTAQTVSCMIGEIGVGNDSPRWNTEMANGLAVAAAAGIQSFTYWAGGPWWGSYPMSIEPRNGQTAPQMAVVRQYGIYGSLR